MTIVLCISIGSTLILLFGIFLIRRRAHLRAKLVSDVSSKSKTFDDEERLVKNEKEEKKPWYSFIRRSAQLDETPKQDYQELCRQRMQSHTSSKSKFNSSLTCNKMSHFNDDNSPGTPGLNNTSNTIVSTPIRIGSDGNEANESSRSSTSSW